MTEARKILALDFDGVLGNSIHDSFMTAVNAYMKTLRGHNLPLKNPLKADTVFQFEEEQPAFFSSFSRLMPLCDRADDYYVLLKILETDPSGIVADQHGFDAVKKAVPSSERNAFKEQFYDIRRRMQEADPVAWSRLLPPFRETVQALEMLSRRFLLAIVTSKDANSVHILLHQYGIASCFERDNILDKDFAPSKRDHLIHLHTRHGVPLAHIHFIDDKVSHLQKVHNLGIRPYLATWGFNTQREIEIAKQEGMGLLTLQDLPRLGASS